MKKLLMATDLSARSDRAVERAVMLALKLGAELTIVHVVDEDLPASLADAQEQAARLVIREHINRLATGKDARISIEVIFGKVYAGILDMSEKSKAEMIILGMHREEWFEDMFRGTTVERTIRAGNVPVLLVKERASTPYRRVVVGVDFSVYSRRAVEFAVEFVPGGEFHLVHAYDVPFKGFLYGHDPRRDVSKQQQLQFQKMLDEEMTTFLGSLEASAPNLERVMQEGTVQDVIHRQISRLKPDLLVIGTHGRTGVAHAFLGSVAEDLLRNPPCDVLVVKAW
jgi:nucleotide-binding universal stress UspA family protein